MHENLTDRLYTLIDLASLLGQQSDFKEILRLITVKATYMIGSDTTLVMMLNPKTRQTIKTVFSVEIEASEKKYNFLHTFISGWVIKNNASFITPNIKTDSRFQRKTFRDSNIESVVCIPLRIEASIIGTLLFLNKNNNKSFSGDDLKLLEKLADIVSPFLYNAQKIRQFFDTPLPEKTLLKKYEAFGLLGKSEKFVELLRSVEMTAHNTVRILLEGGSGTGKEGVARSIHQISLRSKNKFLTIDCAAISANVIESELFGHVRGAFTGANTNRNGLLKEADGGTLFIDEINNLPVEIQARFLRFLQEGEIRPVGSNRVHKVDVRIISASSIRLNELVEKQQFREDLFYRLNVYPITIPSLDERRDDIPVLVNHFLKKFSKQQNKQAELFNTVLLDFLKQRIWPGNIRELENFVERMVTMAPRDMHIIDDSVLPAEFQTELKNIKGGNHSINIHRPLNESMLEYEEKLIRRVLNDCEWNQSKAAQILKISEHGIRYRMQKLGITKKQ